MVQGKHWYRRGNEAVCEGIRRSRFLIYLLALVASACSPGARFEVPQPEGLPDLEDVPRKVRGRYVSPDDSSVLIVTDKLVLLRKKESGWMAMSDFDSTSVDGGNNFSNPSEGIHGSFRIAGDSVWLAYEQLDTIFYMSSQQRLRQYKGHLFLNRELLEGGWKVRLLERTSRNSIELQELLVPADLSQLQEVSDGVLTENGSTDVEKYRLRPTRKQLRGMMKYNFTGKAVFVREK